LRRDCRRDCLVTSTGDRASDQEKSNEGETSPLVHHSRDLLPRIRDDAAVPGSHRAVGVYAAELFGSGEHGPDIRRFDAMRRNRNRAEYGIRQFGSAEVSKDLGHAAGIVKAVEQDLEE